MFSSALGETLYDRDWYFDERWFHVFLENQIADCVKRELSQSKGSGDLEKTIRKHTDLLFGAIFHFYPFAIQQMVAGGVNVNVSTNDGITPLHLGATAGRRYNVSSNNHKHSQDIVEKLIKNGAHVNARSNLGHTPLHIAAVTSPENIALLADYGADIRAKNNEGNTPLHVVAQHIYNKKQVRDRDFKAESEYERGFAVLIEKGANVNMQNNAGETPLHLTASLGETHISGRLVAAGADVNGKNPEGNTSLHLAAQAARAKSIKQLVVLGANINEKNNDGHTPVKLAALGGHDRTVGTLLKLGAEH